MTEARSVPPAPPGVGLKRHPALVALSRDHHHALVQARALRLAAGGTAAERRKHPVPSSARAFLDFYARDLLGHFADEELVVLPLGRSSDPEGVERILAEHRELEGLVAEMRKALDAGTDPTAAMAQAGQLLDDHIRYEERAFFEGLQRRLSADALAEIGRAIEENRAARGVTMSCALPPRGRPLGDLG